MIESNRKPAKVLITNWRDDQEIKDRISAISEKNPNANYAAVMAYIIRKGLEVVEAEHE
jgi:hypothetical protein